MSSAAHKHQASYSITVLNGPDKGAVYKLISGKITIGRGSENDIVIKGDPKCSRNHAAIKVSSTGVEIYDVSKKNVISVDGNVGSSQFLNHDSVILLGKTRLRFKFDNFDEGVTGGTNIGLREVTSDVDPGHQPGFNPHREQPATPPMPMPSSRGLEQPPTAPSSHGGGLGPARPKKSRKRKSPTQKGSGAFYIIIIIVVGLGYILFGEPSKKLKEINVRTNEDVNAEIQDLDKIIAEKKQNFSNKGFETPQYKAAQANFVKGRRDYQKGQFGRALTSFQACLGLFPRHELCARYKRLAEKKKGEMIQYQLVLGRKYKEQNQYDACRSAFKNVMNMVKDTTSLIYKEAKTNAELCKQEMKDDY